MQFKRLQRNYCTGLSAGHSYLLDFYTRLTISHTLFSHWLIWNKPKKGKIGNIKHECNFANMKCYRRLCHKTSQDTRLSSNSLLRMSHVRFQHAQQWIKNTKNYILYKWLSKIFQRKMHLKWFKLCGLGLIYSANFVPQRPAGRTINTLGWLLQLKSNNFPAKHADKRSIEPQHSPPDFVACLPSQ